MAIKIEILGDTWEEIQREIRKIAGQVGLEVINEDSQEDSEDDDDLTKTLEGSGWSYYELARLWSEINQNAREALVEIATRPAPEGYLWWELAPSLGLQKGELGGRMSSIGFALKRALSGKSNPVNYDDSVNRYMMHPGVALVVRELGGNSDN
jgi:hypothetical protein